MEQVRRAANVFIDSMHLPPKPRQTVYEKEISNQQYYAQRNATAARSHHKRRLKQLKEIGIDPDKIKTVTQKSPPC
jgi:hypothetical protein